MANIAKKGAGGLIESIGKKAMRGYLKEVTEGKPVTRAPKSKYDRTRDQAERDYEKKQGLTKEEMAERRQERLERGDVGEDPSPVTSRGPRIPPHGVSPDVLDELDDVNTKMDVRRKIRTETKPTQIRGEESNLEKELYEQGMKGKYGQYKRGGGIELGKVEGRKAPRRMDKKARK